MNNNLIYVAAFLLFSSACTDKKKNSETAKAPETATELTAPPAPKHKNGISPADYEKGLALMGKSDCFTCHKLSEKFVGPAYKDVANRYTANADTINRLALKIINGGVGNWGQVSMTPHATLSKEDAEQTVKYVLSIEYERHLNH